jgi:plastocyanin
MIPAISRRVGLAAAAGAALAALCRRAVAAEPAVAIDNFSFSPAELTVAPGTRVEFTNRDDIPHTVTSAAQPPLFRSAPLDTDDRFAFVFAAAGRYPYFCSLHPHMQGTVIVR